MCRRGVLTDFQRRSTSSWRVSRSRAHQSCNRLSFSHLCFFSEERGHRNAESVRYFDQCSYGRIPMPSFEVGQIAALHRRPLGKLLLGPASRMPNGHDPLGKYAEEVSLRYGQTSMVFCCTTQVTIGTCLVNYPYAYIQTNVKVALLESTLAHRRQPPSGIPDHGTCLGTLVAPHPDVSGLALSPSRPRFSP